MVLKRIIPSLLYNRNGLVKTTNFKNPVYIGDPINSIRIFNNKKVDEISIIDIEDEKETINKYLSFGERAILDGIEKNKEKLEKNNELLNIILMRLDNQ